MAWWRAITGAKRELGEMSYHTAYPVSIPVIPKKLTVLFTLHDVGDSQQSVPCWTYVTKGLKTLGQCEQVITLTLNPGENPRKPSNESLRFFKYIYELAERGQDLTAFSWLQLPAGMFGTERV